MKNRTHLYSRLFNRLFPYRDSGSNNMVQARLLLLLFLLPAHLYGQFHLPAIPSNGQLSNKFEYNAEYIYQVKSGAVFLEDGTLIAYDANGNIRGAQTASVLFPPTNTVVFKIRLFSDSTQEQNLTFRYYDVFNQRIYRIADTTVFKADSVGDFYNPGLLTAYCGPVGKPTGLIPEEGATGQNAAGNFYWQPAENAVFYRLFLWKDGDPVPTVPFRDNIYNTQTYLSNLSYGTLYHWFVVAANQCTEDTSFTRSFTVRSLPDLTISSASAPDTATTVTPFQVTYIVNNVGSGPLTGTSRKDAVYLSADNIPGNGDVFLGDLTSDQGLAAGNNIADSVTVTIPKEFTGAYYLLIKTDNNNAHQETDEGNNFSPPVPIYILPKPLSDLSVLHIFPDKTQAKPGDTLNIRWDIINTGLDDAVGGWTEKISLLSLSGLSKDLGVTTKFSGILKKDSIVSRYGQFVIPKLLPFSGESTIQVTLFPSDSLIEQPGGETNNKGVSDQHIFIQQSLTLSLETSTVLESLSGQVRGYVTRSGETSQPLTVSLSSSLPNALNLPSLVSIPTNNASVMFYFDPVDDTLLNGTRDVVLTAASSGFNVSTDTLTILDDEKPSLILSFDRDTATEGDTLLLSLALDLAPSDSTIIYLSTDKPQQCSFPSEVTFPASQAFIQIPVLITENMTPELNALVTVKGRSEKIISGEAGIVIRDNDVPAISLEILADSVSESAGPYATWGIIRRLDNRGGSVRVQLQSLPGNTLYFPATVTLNNGEMQKQFNIGVIDNNLVDGFRTIKLSGSVFIQSCGCQTTADNGGIVSDQLTLIDNDGPSLSISVTPASLAEGKSDAGTMTVFRNTPTDTALQVNLLSKDTTELTLPATVTIPAGASTVQVTLATKDDNIDDGNQTVILSASAPGFSPGTGWVYVTDINRPDLEITGVELASDTVVTGESMVIQADVLNNGYGTAPSGVKVAFYLSQDNRLDDKDSLIHTATIADPIAIGGSAHLLEVVTFPGMTGNYHLFLKANPDLKITELVYANNASAPVPVLLLPAYTAVAMVDPVTFTSPVPVTIHGSATMRDGSPAANADLDVYILWEKSRRVLNTTSDQNGNFNTLFEPTQFESGHYIVGACYPGEETNTAQDSFDIMGMERVSRNYFTWNLKLEVPDTGTVRIRNRSMAPLHDVTLNPISLPDGCILEFDTIPVLKGDSIADIHYVVKGTILTVGTNYLDFPMEVTSSDGVSFRFTGYYYCQALAGHLVSTPASLNTTITKGKVRYYDLTLVNEGAGETGPINIELPDAPWLSLVTGDTISSMLPGDTTVFTLMLLSNDELPLNTPVSGNINIHVTNGNGLSIPFRIEVVSEETGSLEVDVVDEYTYFTEEAPHVANAHVVVRHPFSGRILAEGFTDTTGIFHADSLPEGPFVLNVDADRHDGVRKNIIIDPGRVLKETVFMSFQAISYSWEVVPVEIEDRYQVDLVMKFETNVPVPVVVMEMPDVMPALVGDETYSFMVTLTNKGLITAEDITIGFPDDPEYEWIYNFPKTNLLAQQSVQVPVIMQRKTSTKSSNPSGGQAKAGGPCGGLVLAWFKYECGKDRVPRTTFYSVRFGGRPCSTTGGQIGDIGGGGGLPGGPASPISGLRYTDGPGTGITIPVSGGSSETGCDPCFLADVGIALACIPIPGFGTAGCILGLFDGIDLMDFVGCVAPPGWGCALAMDQAAVCHFNNGKKGGGAPAKGGIPPILEPIFEDIHVAIAFFTAKEDYISQFMGTIDWSSKESFQDFLAETDSVVSNKTYFDTATVSRIREHMLGMDITGGEIDYFVTRWNSTMDAWSQNIFSPTAQYPDIVDKSVLDSCIQVSDSSIFYAESRGFANVPEMYNKAVEDLNTYVEGERSSVCASVTIKISQKLVMTREAFEGTLTIFNGNTTTSMQEINLNLEIRNEAGELANDLFQIETKALDIITGIDGTGTLGPEQKGSATVLFIPEKGAAPEVPASYSFGGSFSYLDPYTGTTVTRELSPVTLEVHPSPDLFMHYFMQRDILGDDPLTEPIEPIVPAELALMIVNNGYGTAKSVRVESAQPEIVDNEKGLSIHFALIGSNLNGQPRQLGLTNIDFGNILPKSATIGQWWFTSDLLGHFVDYKTQLTHLDSRGNPDLSLVSGATLHELIHSIRVYGSQDDGINDFLVNEVQDVQEIPDALYLSQGDQVLDVYPADAALFSGAIATPAYSNTLKVIVSHMGWNYVRLNDPGNGNYELVSVTRNSDGQVIPLSNAWQTFVTLPDGSDPVYENKFHFIDFFANTGEQEYTVVWKMKPANELKIVSIEGPAQAIVATPVTSVNVTFNKKVDPATFTWEDMMLRLQGGNDLMDSSVVVSTTDSVTFTVNLSTLTTGDGYYVLTVQAADISDLDGFSGKTGKQFSWSQFLNAPLVEEFIGVPESGSGPPFDYLLVRFNRSLDVYTLNGSRFILSRNDTVLSGSPTVTMMDADAKLFRISGLQPMMTIDGIYTLTVDLPNIATTDGNKGVLQQSVSWRTDTTPPDILSFEKIYNGGFDAQHATAIDLQFTEPVKGVGISSVELWKDSTRQPLSQVHVTPLPGNVWRFSQFRLLTYYEGNYTFKIHLDMVTDSAGLKGMGTRTFQWSVYRGTPQQVQNLHITPDLGYLDTDGITSVTDLVLHMTVADTSVRKVEIYRNIAGSLTFLGDSNLVNSGSLSIPITYPYAGGGIIEVHALNRFGNYSMTQIPVFIDQTALHASWKNTPTEPVLRHPDSLWLVFSGKLLESSLDTGFLALTHNGTETDISQIRIQKMSDTLFLVTGFDTSRVDAGTYTLSYDLTGVHKYLSGLQGNYRASTEWEIINVNRAPTASAGADFTAVAGNQYTLDGTGSSDPDNDPLMYEWFAPDSITLDNNFSPTPSFVVPQNPDTTILSFILLVSDGEYTSTDVVQVFITQATAVTDPNADPRIVVYPNPASEHITVRVYNFRTQYIRLLDMTGKTVLIRKWTGDDEETINVAGLAPGLYFLSIETYEKRVVRKVLIR